MFWYWTLSCRTTIAYFLLLWILLWHKHWNSITYHELIWKVCEILVGNFLIQIPETGSISLFCKWQESHNFFSALRSIHPSLCISLAHPNTQTHTHTNLSYGWILKLFTVEMYVRFCAKRSTCYAACHYESIPSHITVKRKQMLTLGHSAAEAVTYNVHLHVHFCSSWADIE